MICNFSWLMERSALQLKVEAEDAMVAGRRQALEAEKAAKAAGLKQRAESARQRILEQVGFIALRWGSLEGASDFLQRGGVKPTPCHALPSPCESMTCENSS